MQSSCTKWLKIAVSVALVAVFALSAGAAPVAERPAPGKFEPEKWIAEGSDVVMAINVRVMLDAPMMKKGGLPALKDALKSNEMAKNILKAAGIDPFKDIQTILVSGKGKDAKDAKAQIIIRGNFDPDKFRTAAEACAKKNPDDVKVIKSGGIYFYEMHFPQGKLVGAFANKNTLVLTQNQDATLEVVKNGGKKVATVNKALKGAVSKFTGKESMSMAMVVTDEMKKGLGKLPQAAEVAPKLQTINSSLVLTNEANFNVILNTADEASAKKAGQLLRQAKSLVELAILNNEDIPPVASDLLAALKISAERNSVVINLKVTQDLLDKAGKKE
jgi:hypothetical protein